MCISVCAVCIIHVCVCVCVAQRGCQPASQPGSSVCLRSLSTSWVSQVLGCPLTPPGPPITAALQARSVNCHLLPDQYQPAPRTTCHSTTEGSDNPLLGSIRYKLVWETLSDQNVGYFLAARETCRASTGTHSAKKALLKFWGKKF